MTVNTDFHSSLPSQQLRNSSNTSTPFHYTPRNLSPFQQHAMCRVTKTAHYTIHAPHCPFQTSGIPIRPLTATPQRHPPYSLPYASLDHYCANPAALGTSSWKPTRAALSAQRIPGSDYVCTFERHEQVHYVGKCPMCCAIETVEHEAKRLGRRYRGEKLPGELFTWDAAADEYVVRRRNMHDEHNSEELDELFGGPVDEEGMVVRRLADFVPGLRPGGRSGATEEQRRRDDSMLQVGEVVSADVYGVRG